MKDKNIDMIPFEQAFETVRNSAFSVGNETIPFAGSLNRVLGEDVASDMFMPPFNKASVDGFACRKADLEKDLEIIETIPAGIAPGKIVGDGQCSKIMTGAEVPPGADCVVMVEETEMLKSGKIKFKGILTKENIAFKGEDIKKGDIVLKPGRLIRPQDIAVMAALGHTSLRVSKMPHIAVISSGSELVEPSEFPGISQIRNSNASQLMAQVERAGARGKYYGIARDNEDETFKIVQNAIYESDLVLITGGVSMGDFDFVPSVLEKAGVRILFSRIAVQPGKPTVFGIHEKALVFGLPGNPVSSFMMCEMLVRPLIYKMMEYNWKPLELKFMMKDTFTRKFADRMALIPVEITGDGHVRSVEFHGSAHISALHYAFGIISLPAGIKVIEKGEIVSVRQI